MNLAVEWVKQPIILEIDCANLVSILTGSEFDRAQLCLVLRSIKLLLQALPNFRVQKIRRECNSVAHDLAKFAMSTNH